MTAYNPEFLKLLPTDVAAAFVADHENHLGRNLTKEETTQIDSALARYHLYTPMQNWVGEGYRQDHWRQALLPWAEEMLANPVIAKGLSHRPYTEIHYRYLTWVVGVSPADTNTFMR